MMIVSVKYQITLPEELAFRLKEAAVRRQIPMAQFIRETMEDKLRQSDTGKRSRDPFSRIRGIVDSPETDLSTRVDEILYRGGESR